MLRSATEIEGIRKALIDWFAHEGKVYPWRLTTDPWHILVSEVMLQQTTIPTILGRYDEWMSRFPTPEVMAAASEEEALRSWEGLGYYRRVRSLKAIAEVIVVEYGGVFPSSPELLMKLPGIGEYTCGAVLSFAFNLPAPIVDANVSRVIARLNNYCDLVDATPGKKYMWAQAAALVDPINPREFNSALMELGQTYCKPLNPDCLLCPLRSFCRAESPESLPVKTPKPKVTEKVHHDLFFVKGGCLLLTRIKGGRHEGMYRFPERNESDVAGLPLIVRQSYTVTRYRMIRFLYESNGSIMAGENEVFMPVDELDSIPMPSPDRKALSIPAIRCLLKRK